MPEQLWILLESLVSLPGNEFDFNGFLEAWNDTYFDAWKDFYSGKGMGAETYKIGNGIGKMLMTGG